MGSGLDSPHAISDKQPRSSTYRCSGELSFLFRAEAFPEYGDERDGWEENSSNNYSVAVVVFGQSIISA